MVPRAVRLAVLVNPGNASTAEATLNDVKEAARPLGLQTQVFNAGNSREIQAVFTSLSHERNDALFVGLTVFSTPDASNLLF